MIIALDYDGTFTKDPRLWAVFIESAKAAEHYVVGCTMRYESEWTDMDRNYLYKCDRIVFTGRNAKKEFLEKLGIRPDVWIDDRPDFILRNATP
jgi:hypothetical protein